MGIQPAIERGRSKSQVRPEMRFENRGVHYRLLDVGPRAVNAWEKIHGRQFDLLFDDELNTFQPDLVFGFGGMPGEASRYARARRRGAKVVFALCNASYTTAADLLGSMDGIVTPSRFLTGFYREKIGIASTPLPDPISLTDVVATERDPIFVTMINPSHEKGLMLMTRLAEELSVRRPDIPMLIIESRGSAGKLVQAGMLAGFDLRRHENLMMSPALPEPKEIYVPTRMLLVPSLGNEASGRVAAEALINGIPPLVSDRGGLAENCNGAGFTIPVPADITARQRVPVSAAVVEPWLDLIFRLEGDDEFYQAESRRALEAGRMFHPDVLGPRYVEYFESVLE